MFKKSLLLAAIAAGLMSMTALAESYARLESQYGNIDIVGTECVEQNGKNYLVILAQYENTTDESTYATSNILINVYQHGIEMEGDYISGYKPREGYFDYMTKARHGATINFYKVYQLTDNTAPVDIEIKPIWSGDMVECTMPVNSELSDEADNAYTPGELTEAVPNPYEERIAALEALVADLTARIEALEAK